MREMLEEYGSMASAAIIGVVIVKFFYGAVQWFA